MSGVTGAMAVNNYDGALIFEKGAEGRSGASLPPLDVPPVDVQARFGAQARSADPGLPQVSEPEAVRHYLALSQLNYAIDRCMVPLGSCTMKYNPKVNEWAARLEGFAELHPFADTAHSQGALALMFALEGMLAEICGMDGVSLHPAAGAQGELAGLMMLRAYHQSQGRAPRKVLIPESAHGTNPASCRLNGLEVVPFRVGEQGVVRLEQLEPLLTDEVAALMLTNPNTLGLFEGELPQIAERVHACGGLVYGDGANLNALLGKTRPGDLGIDVMQFNLHKTFTTPHGGGGPGCGPVAFREILAPFAPVPVVRRDEAGQFHLDYDRPQSVGRLRGFHGNFAMMVRAYAYIRELGPEGLRAVAEQAVLNANYLRVLLADAWHQPHPRLCMHEVVLSDRSLKDSGVSTLDVAKRLIDEGFHPPTMYFPLVVKGALLIEPTETESRETLERFAEVMTALAEEARSEPQRMKAAPERAPLRRLDETRAARQPVVRAAASH